MDGYLTNLPELLQSGADFPEQESHQEVVLAEVICQWVIQLEVWEEEDNNEKLKNTMELTLIWYNQPIKLWASDDTEIWTLLTFTNKSEVGMYDIGFFFFNQYC